VEPSGMNPSSHLTRRRRELLEWFQQNAPSLAEAYEAAVRLIGCPEFPARLHLVSHLVRDIANRLPDVLEGTTSERVEYVNILDDIDQLWRKRFPHATDYGDQAVAQDVSSVVLPEPLFRKLEGLLHLHRESRRRLRPQERLFRSELSPEVASPVLVRPMVKQFEDVCNWFQTHTHLRNETGGIPNERELVQNFENFERVLVGIKGQFFTNIGEIDEILQDTNP